MSSAPTAKKNGLLRKRWVQVWGGVLFAVPLLFILGIYGVKSYLIDWLTQNGADSATIEKLALNPFTGRLTLKGLDAQVAGKSLLKNTDMIVNVGYGGIFKKNIEVQNASYSGLVLDLEQYADGSMRIGSYTVAKGEKETEGEGETTEDIVSAWAFLADQVTLTDCKVMLKTPDLDLELIVEEAALRKFTTREGEPGASLSFNGTLNGELIEIELSKLLVMPFLQLEGEVTVARFQFSEIARLLEDALPVFAGDIGLGGHLAFSLGEGGAMVVDYNGDIEARRPDIGSDSFATQADKLTWQGRVHYESAEDKPMIIETDGLLAAKEYAVAVAAADFTTQASNIELSGKTRVTIVDNVVVDNDGTLLIEKAAVRLPGNEIDEERLHWQGAVVYDSNRSGAGQYVATKGELQLGQLAYALGADTTETSVQSRSLSWKGDLVYGQAEETNAYVKLNGNLDGSDISTVLAGSGMKIGQDIVALTSDATVTFGEAFDIKGSNSLVVNTFSFSGGADVPEIALDKLEILNLEGLGDQGLRLKQLSSTGLSVALAGNLPMDITVPEINLNGFSTEDLAHFNVDSVLFDQPEIVATHNGEELLRLEEIKAQALQLDDAANLSVDNISLGSLIFLGVAEGSQETPFLTLGKANLSGLAWSGDDGLTGDSLTFTDLVTTSIRSKDGELNVSRQLSAMQVNNPVAEGVEEVKEESEAAKGLPIRLGEVAVTGKSHVKFEDYTLAVPYLTNLAIKKMQLLDLDSTQPESKSSFVLEAQLEERAPFNITGDISPFMAPIALDLKIVLKNYPLSRLSAYTVQSVGTALASGQLQLNTQLELENDHLDMENALVLKKLETDTISPELAEELNNQLPIPLDAALSILRDSDRNISLNIPLSGPVSDLSVGISDVLITGLSKAIVPAASGYLMYTLGPYGALAYVGMKVGEKMLKVELPPVDFVPGGIELADEHKKYLEKVADILKGRPETDIQLCPKVVSSEFMDEKQRAAIKGSSIEVVEEDREKLVDLGQQRAKAIQSYLVSTYRVESSRLLICNTLIETDKNVKPSVMLNL